MDKTTARMCHEGTGRIGYTRVLEEVNVEKGLKERIEICYKCESQVDNCTNYVNVKYNWKPPRCSKCKLFGHGSAKCSVVDGRCEGHEEDNMGNNARMVDNEVLQANETDYGNTK
ncbi:ATPase, F1/V1/A1 complex, alpha/beta subunit, Zinc knuckle CX2CX4HX4C [Artemisia annua]|uniref:ATPase, F1/V1/A1 complex, alpha/beta subunit, Zinc knuckle CX2CX4HX4C n=1 Tax=Artemisia annua TaxID=35608 RepID=A0A2U1NQI6_ARTAN|nr:ATPase, F1/V1/A1 complex, alpha/beta subunit, Zinc knuckle CX2CX4HX4C [Artemisia annua]